jgi:hypothetical protein
MGVSIQNMVLMDHDSGIQALDQCMLKYQSRNKGANADVTFVTEEKLDDMGALLGQMKMQKMAFIVWLDRAKAQALLDSKTPKGIGKEHEAPLRSLLFALQKVKNVGADAAFLGGVDIYPLLDNLEAIFGVEP